MNKAEAAIKYRTKVSIGHAIYEARKTNRIAHFRAMDNLASAAANEDLQGYFAELMESDVQAVIDLVTDMIAASKLPEEGA